MKKKIKKWKKRFRTIEIPRIYVLIFIFFVLTGILVHRLFSLQIIHGQEYADNFSLETTKERTLKSTRGNIYDRNGNLLAYDQLSYSVIFEDTEDYSSTREKNLSINGTIYQIIQLIEANGDQMDSNFHIQIDENGEYVFDVSGTSLLRFRADVYGHVYISELTEEEKNITAEDMITYLKSSFGLVGSEKRPYTTEELMLANLPLELSKEDTLKIISVRYSLWTTSYRKYLQTTIATDVSETTVAAILENQSQLQGVDIREDSVRVYPNAEYFASILGYTGKISSDELDELEKENPDSGYTLNSIVGKSGLEKVMETTLQGSDGHETVRVDTTGRVLEIIEKDSVSPVQGNNVYTTLDMDLQIACYKILEQKIAGILVANIQNIKTFTVTDATDGSSIPIPIYDVYYALIENSILDIDHFSAEDASDTEKKVYQKFFAKQEKVFEQIHRELTSSESLPYSDLSEEMQEYLSYIVNQMLMSDTGILKSDSINKNDSMYKAWTKEESISLQQYLTYAASQNWIDISKFSGQSTYMDSDEVYNELSEFICAYLETDLDFCKILYHYMLLDDEISGRDLCLILYDQDILSKTDSVYESFLAGRISAMELMIKKISNLEITPAQLALDPCSGSVVIVDPSSGETLACVSYPGYDNNRLANTMDSAYYSKLVTDLSSPFYNKATQEKTAPGSTFKPLMAAAGLNEGVLDTTNGYFCSGIFDRLTGSSLKCWYKKGHGTLNVAEAIENSCNVFFSELSYDFGCLDTGTFSEASSIAMIQKYASIFNLDKKSGLEITESSPQVSDQMPIASAIGQGTHNYTTSQLARYVASIASRGLSYNISLLDKTTDSNGNLLEDYTPELLSTIDFDESIWDTLQTGMVGVVKGSSAFDDLKISLAGKTGTAQQSKARSNHGLFIGYAPVENPEIAMAVRITNGYSSKNASLVAKDILNYYFALKDETEILDGKAETDGMENTTQTD